MAQGTGKKGSRHDGESDVWNVADGFVKFKILLHLIRVDDFITIAIHGSPSIDDMTDEEKYFKNPVIVFRRINALRRLKDELKALIRNTAFKIKDKDKETYKKFTETIIKIEKNFKNIKGSRFSQVKNTRSHQINEIVFDDFLSKLEAISGEIHEPLDRAGLIFRNVEELDFKKIEEMLLHGG